MAIGSAQSTKSPTTYEAMIRAKLRDASRDLKWFELLGLTAKMLAVGVIALLITVAIDHWIWPLPLPIRVLAWVALISAALWTIVTRIGPLLVLKLNPVYVARRIESSSPDLKNSLVNCLTYRSGHTALARFVTRALQQKAATDLSRIPPDAAVDRRTVLRSVYLLAIAMALFAAYALVSPKSTWQSVRRVLQPWAGISSPTRVEILRVMPGDHRVVFGDRVTIEVEVEGIRDGDGVTLAYDSLDRKTTGFRQPMQSKDGQVFTATLPADSHRGIEADIRYHIEAGDARSRDYVLTVEPEPAMLIEQIDYEYPAYVGQESRTVVGQGSVRAIDGTKVTVRARANQPIASARFLHLPGDSDKPRPFAMLVDGNRATYSFRLDIRYGTRQAYQLDMQTKSGRRARKTVEYDIEVVTDLPPEVEIRMPKRSPVVVPLNDGIPISIRAIDPDFGLAEVALVFDGEDGELAGRRVSLLPDGWTMSSSFTGQYVFRPSEWRLAPGDKIHYRAFAQDNRNLPRRDDGGPNEAYSVEQIIIVGEPVAQPKTPQAEPSTTTDPSNSDQQPPNQTDSKDRPDSSAHEKPSQHPDSAEPMPRDQRADTDGSDPDAVTPRADSSKLKDKPQPDQPTKPPMPMDSRSNSDPTESKSNQDAEPSPTSPAESQTPPNQTDSELAESKTEQGEPSGQGATSQQADASEQEASSGKPTSQDSGAESKAGNQGESDPNLPPTHDGDVFERALEYLQEKGQPKQRGEPSNAAEPTSGAGDQGEEGDQGEATEDGTDSSPEHQPTDSNTSKPKDSSTDRRQGTDGAEGGGETPPRPNTTPESPMGERSAEQQTEGDREPSNGGDTATDANSAADGSPMNAPQPEARPPQPNAQQGNRGDQKSPRPEDSQENNAGNMSKRRDTPAGQEGSANAESSDARQAEGNAGKSGGGGEKSSQAKQPTQSDANTQATDQQGSAGREGAAKSQNPSSTDQGNPLSSDPQSAGQSTKTPASKDSAKSAGGESKPTPSNRTESSDRPQGTGRDASSSEENPAEAGDSSSTRAGSPQNQRSQGAEGTKGSTKRGPRSGEPQATKQPGSAGENAEAARQNPNPAAKPQGPPKPADSEGENAGRKPKTSGTGTDAPTGAESSSGERGGSESEAQRSGESGSRGGERATSPSQESSASDSGSDSDSGRDSDSGSDKASDGQPSKRGGDAGRPSSGGSESDQQASPTPGQAGQSKPGQGGGQSGTSSKGSPTSSPSAQGQSSGSSSGTNSGQPGGVAGNAPGGGATDRQGPAAAGQFPQGAPAGLDGAPADAANEEYSRRVTNLVLDYLKQQKDRPDPELLKRLNWTPEELRQFVDRWERLRQLEKNGDESAQRKLKRMYRSLGLRPTGDDRRAEQQRQDQVRGLSDAVRTEPPTSYAEKFRAYKRSVAR